MKAGSGEVIWGDTDELPIGYYEFTVCSEVEGVSLSSALGAEVFPKRLEYRFTPDTVEERKKRRWILLSAARRRALSSILRIWLADRIYMRNTGAAVKSMWNLCAEEVTVRTSGL